MPHSMPSEIAEMQKQLRAEQEALIDAMEAEEIAERERVLSYAWLICACRPWPEPGNRAPAQAGCPVHGNVMITRAGRVL
jgi:hypothetical protein